MSRASELELWEKMHFKKKLKPTLATPENLPEQDNVCITFLNWNIIRDGWGKPSYMAGKSRTQSGEIIWFKTFLPCCYLMYTSDADELEGTYEQRFDIGQFTILDNTYAKGINCAFNFKKKNTNKELSLLVCTKPNINLHCLTEKSYTGLQWFFVFNKINPAGSYSFNKSDPRIREESPNVWKSDLMDFPFEPIPYFCPPLMILSFDLECYTVGQFSPQTQPITHCAITLDKITKSRKFCLVDTKSIPDWNNKIKLRSDSVWCNDQSEFYSVYKKKPDIKYFYMVEKQLLLVIKGFLESDQIDYVLTYNGHCMDIPYVNKRLEVYGIPLIHTKIPSTDTETPLVFKKSKSSNLLSTERCDIYSANGTLFFDLHNFVKKEEIGLNSYSLEALSKKNFNGYGTLVKKGTDHWTWEFRSTKNKSLYFLTKLLESAGFINLDNYCLPICNKVITETVLSFQTPYLPLHINLETEQYFEFGKDDVEIDKIYINYNMKIAEEIAPYCQHDSNLCLFLWEKYNIKYKINAASFLYKLSQDKVLFWYATTTSKGPILEYYMKSKKLYLERCVVQKTKYQGATVFEPDEKIISAPVLVFDYNSLYPNSCIFGNLSPETLVCHVYITDSVKLIWCMKKLKEIYTWPDYIVVNCGSVTGKYISEILVYDRREIGIIPSLLKEFISLRKDYKRKMKTCPDDYFLYDNLQLVTKLSANSIYGLLGTNEFVLKSIHSAKACTSIGRDMLQYLDDVFKSSEFKEDGLYLTNPIMQIWKNEPLKRFYPSPTKLTQCKIKRVYGDTDSIFTKLLFDTTGNVLTMASKIGKFFEDTINKEILFDQFVVEFEYILINVIMFSKKKYYGEKYNSDYKENDQPEISGKGYKKRDMCDYYLDLSKQVDIKIKTLIKQNPDVNVLRRHVVQFLLAEFKALLTGKETKVENNKFYFTRRYGADTEKGENPNSKLIKEWNKSNPNKTVMIGERYYYTYVCDRELNWQTNVKNKRMYEYILENSQEKIPSNMRIFYEIILSRVCDRVFKSFDSDQAFIKGFSSKLFGTKSKLYNMAQVENWSDSTMEILLNN
ncbi:DNA polymerase elongation subunit family B [Salmon gill poxvirus]